jgi:hypothetical protein
VHRRFGQLFLIGFARVSLCLLNSVQPNNAISRRAVAPLFAAMVASAFRNPSAI